MVSGEGLVEDLERVQVPAVRAQRVRVQTSSVDHLEADIADIERSVVQQVQSAHVELGKSAVRRVEGNVVEVTASAVGYAKASEASFRQTVVGACGGTTLSAHTSIVGALGVAQRAQVTGSVVGFVGGREVRADGVRAVVVVASRLDGNVTTLLSQRQALVAGAAFALVWFILRRLFRR
jgi:hypothetical protein